MITQIIPFKGISQVAFGDSLEHVSASIFAKNSSYSDYSNRQYFPDWDMVIHYDSEQKVNFIEFFNSPDADDFILEYNGSALLNNNVEIVINNIKHIDSNPIYKESLDMEITFFEIGLILIEEDKTIKSVAIFPKGYYTDPC